MHFLSQSWPASVTVEDVDVWISLSDGLFDKLAQQGFESSRNHWTESPAENTDNAYIYTLSKPLPVALCQLSGSFETWFLTLAHESWGKTSTEAESIQWQRWDRTRKGSVGVVNILPRQPCHIKAEVSDSVNVWVMSCSEWERLSEGSPLYNHEVLEHKQSMKQLKDEEEPSCEELGGKYHSWYLVMVMSPLLLLRMILSARTNAAW